MAYRFNPVRRRRHQSTSVSSNSSGITLGSDSSEASNVDNLLETPGVFGGGADFLDNASIEDSMRDFIASDSDEIMISESQSVHADSHKADDSSKFVKVNRTFLQNQWALFERGEHDAIVKIEETEFKVLKIFFIAQSEVFACMFSSNFKEGQTNTVDMKDVSEETMKAMIKWLYTGQLEEESPIEDLFKASDKYDIKGLTETCIQRLTDSMNKKNAFSRLIFAVMHNEDQLKNAALTQIAKMSAVEGMKMLTDPKWSEFARKNPEVADEINKLINEKLDG